jgi:hypothetical protein
VALLKNAEDHCRLAITAATLSSHYGSSLNSADRTPNRTPKAFHSKAHSSRSAPWVCEPPKTKLQRGLPFDRLRAGIKNESCEFRYVAA